jgi:osmotically-inducible protein OsmY
MTMESEQDRPTRMGRGPQQEPPEPQRPPQRRYPPGPKGYQRSDERLREDISERLMLAHEIDSSEVTVEVTGARAVLDGTVPQRWMKHAIEDLVDACPGVQDIDNRIRISR